MHKFTRQSSSDLYTIPPSILKHYTTNQASIFLSFLLLLPFPKQIFRSHWSLPSDSLFPPSPPFFPYSCHTCLLDLLVDCRSRQLGLAQVGLNKELDKEHKVAEVHEGGPHNVLHVRWTLLTLLHPRVHQVVDHAAHDHLGDLGQGDEHRKLARELEARRSQGVVGVHDGVDQVVHGHEPAAASHHVFVGVPGVEQHGNVMVPVEEDEFLLPQDNEESVTCEREIIVQEIITVGEGKRKTLT